MAKEITVATFNKENVQTILKHIIFLWENENIIIKKHLSWADVLSVKTHEECKRDNVDYSLWITIPYNEKRDTIKFHIIKENDSVYSRLGAYCALSLSEQGKYPISVVQTLISGFIGFCNKENMSATIECRF